MLYTLNVQILKLIDRTGALNILQFFLKARDGMLHVHSELLPRRLRHALRRVLRDHLHSVLLTPFLGNAGTHDEFSSELVVDACFRCLAVFLGHCCRESTSIQHALPGRDEVVVDGGDNFVNVCDLLIKLIKFVSIHEIKLVKLKIKLVFRDRTKNRISTNMDSLLYMPVSDHAKLPASFLKYAHTAVSSRREKRSKLRKTVCFFPAQPPAKSPSRI